MNDVERYWEAIRKKWPTPTPSYHELDPMEQMMLVQSIRCKQSGKVILLVLSL